MGSSLGQQNDRSDDPNSKLWGSFHMWPTLSLTLTHVDPIIRFFRRGLPIPNESDCCLVADSCTVSAPHVMAHDPPICVRSGICVGPLPTTVKCEVDGSGSLSPMWHVTAGKVANPSRALSLKYSSPWDCSI